jgi:hypothetical protein
MTQELSSQAESAEWYFFNGGPGTPRYGDDPTKHALDHDTETFVREVLQNANDQGLANSDPVEVTFRFVTLEGDERDAFLEALQWDSGLSDRLDSLSKADRGRGYQRFVDDVTDPESELRLLIVEDRNTTGLTGGWDDASNYAALVRDELYSSKQADTAGGSYGLGKSVLWTFSSASTVVFNSHPHGLSDTDESSQRVIGRTKLPTHERDGRTFQGAGWLCRPKETDEGVRPESLSGPSATDLAERLHLDRPAASGTSAMVVGYNDPTRDVQSDLEELLEEFVESAVKYFWPALSRGDLRVFVETPDERREADVHAVPSIRPFVECYEARHDCGDSLEVPGDVAGLDIPMTLPPLSDGTETEDGTVRLAARLASPVDEDSHVNEVALFRGAGMVVKYLDQSRVAFGDRNFFGVLAAGRARGEPPTPADEEIDRFLRFAEPPTHDEWESTENLRDEYQRGFRMAIDDMFDTLRDGLRHLVARSTRSESTLSNRVLKRFPIHGGVKSRPNGSPPEVAFDISSSSAFEGDQWAFSGTISPEQEFVEWTAEISLTGVGEDGSRQNEVPIASVSTDSTAAEVQIEEGVAKLVGGREATEVSFGGKSVTVGSDDIFNGDVGETQLEIRAELTTTEGE